MSSSERMENGDKIQVDIRTLLNQLGIEDDVQFLDDQAPQKQDGKK